MNIMIQTTTGPSPDFELVTRREFDLVCACLVNLANPSHNVENIAQVIKDVREEECQRVKATLIAEFKLEVSDDEANRFYEATEGVAVPDENLDIEILD